MTHRRISFQVCLLVAATLFVSPFVSHAQSPAQPNRDVGAIVAGLREDIRILDERTRALTIEIEQLRRENVALREQASSTSNLVTVSQFNTALSELEKAIRSGDSEVLVKVTQQMERLAKQTQSAIDTVAKSTTGTRTTAPVNFNFTDDYPKQGTTYVVESGDTISSIAQKFGSSVRDIQNANKIADARTLQVGQVIFVPQR
jgi:LysM repeat protein